MSKISVRGAVKRYKLGKTVVEALKGLDLEIDASEIMGIVGPSGSGKSTLLNLIGCIDKADEGEVLVGGIDVARLDEAELTALRRTGIGFVFQSFNLIPVLTARENVDLPLSAMGVRSEERRSRVEAMLERVGLAEFGRRRPDELSGGQRQRVAIARALITRPALVLADEPTANLDGETGRSILELMRTMNQEIKTTFVLATHDPRVLPFLDRRVHVEDGRVARIEEMGRSLA
jgi:ABC-type antimicrobial peptide transport system, ATPase component